MFEILLYGVRGRGRRLGEVLEREASLGFVPRLFEGDSGPAPEGVVFVVLLEDEGL